MFDISLHSHLHGTCKCLEDTFYLVVLVGSFCLDVQVHARTVREAFEEVQEHFRGHLPHLFPLELCIPHQPRASAKVQAHLAQAIVHGQAVSISFYATLVTKGLGKAFAQGKGSVLYGMVFVYVQVATACDVEVYVAMTGNLLEHVVEETKTGADVAFSVPVKADAYVYVRFVGLAAYGCPTVSGKEDFRYTLPIHILAYYKTLTTKVHGQLGIRLTVAYHIGVGHIYVRILHV